MTIKLESPLIMAHHVYTGYSSFQHASPLWELTCHMGSQCYWQRWHSHLYFSQLKLVLNLATPEGCKA